MCSTLLAEMLVRMGAGVGEEEGLGCAVQQHAGWHVRCLFRSSTELWLGAAVDAYGSNNVCSSDTRALDIANF
jgi:hypothetical protein